MEKDKELKDDGNSYTTEFRQYDPRLGRWLSLDPLMAQFPWMSPYVGMDNNPVLLNDPLGLSTSDGGKDGPREKPKNKPFFSNPKLSAWSWIVWMKARGKIESAKVKVHDNKSVSVQYTVKEKRTGSGLAKRTAEGDEIEEVSANVVVFRKRLSAEETKGLLTGNKIPGPGDYEWERSSSGAMISTSIATPFLDYGQEKLAQGLQNAGMSEEASNYTSAGIFFIGSVTLSRKLPMTPTGKFYSVAYEVKLPQNIIKSSYGTHFRYANKSLISAMNSDQVFENSMKNLNVTFKVGLNGKNNLSTSPNNFVWHHDVEVGVMQLVPKYQHSSGSIFWNTLHPGGYGGMSIWGNKTK